MSKSASPPDSETTGFDEETEESLAFVADNYDGVVGAAAAMLLQSSEEASNE